MSFGNAKVEVQKSKYPYIGESRDSIVFFVDKGKGLKLYPTQFIEYREDWIEESFNIFDGKLTLENKNK